MAHRGSESFCVKCMKDVCEYQKIAEEAGKKLGLTEVFYEGKGAFKETFRAYDKELGVIAMKVIDRKNIDIKRTQREVESLSRCRSKHIAAFHSLTSHKSSDGRDFDIVLEEFLDGGTLESLIQARQLSPKEAEPIFFGLTHALFELEKLRLVHRDIKPANIMFRQNSPFLPVLVDFGLVRDLSKLSLTQTWAPRGPGTPYFSAPEQLNNDKEMIDWRTDQFCVGVVMAIAMTDNHPYAIGTMTPSETVYSVAQRRDLSPTFVEFTRATNMWWLEKMVSPWPIQRFTSPSQLLSAIQNK